MSETTSRTQALTATSAKSGLHRSGGALFVTAFIIALLVPIVIEIGSIRLSFYRIVLLITFFPSLVFCFRCREIRLLYVDMLMVGFAIYVGVSYLATRASVATIGIHFVETLGPYMLARAYIRTMEEFTVMVRVMTYCIVLTIPFALYENFTRDPIILSTLGKVLQVLPNVPHEIRLGLDRAQVVFDHPILYGIFCAAGFSFAIYVSRLGSSQRPSLRNGLLVGIAAFLSLSSGAIVCVVIQGLLFLYDQILRRWRARWIALVTCATALYTLLELASNRSMAQISIQFIALNPGTAWTRLAVNEAAIEELKKFPWFGAGIDYIWHPPHWVVTGSIDNFWIATAFRNGFPSAVLIIAVVVAALVTVGFVRTEDPRVRACQTAWCITLVSLAISIFTVHLWNSTYVLLMFLLGCALWVREAPRNLPLTVPNLQSSHLQYTRFKPNGPHREDSREK